MRRSLGVQGNAYGPGLEDGEVGDDVVKRVFIQQGYSVALFHSELPQGTRKAIGIRFQLRIGHPFLLVPQRVLVRESASGGLQKVWDQHQVCRQELMVSNCTETMSNADMSSQAPADAPPLFFSLGPMVPRRRDRNIRMQAPLQVESVSCARPASGFTKQGLTGAP